MAGKTTGRKPATRKSPPKSKAPTRRGPLVSVTIARRPRRRRGSFASFLIGMLRELRTMRTAKTTPVRRTRPAGKTGVTRADGAARFAAFKASRPDMFDPPTGPYDQSDPDTDPDAGARLADLDAQFGEVFDPGI